MSIKLFASLSLWALALTGMAQEKVVPVKYGDMNQWVTRRIYESGIIGGHTKLLYELGPTQEIDGNVAYVNQGGSLWANSNVMAKVMGIVKTNTSVYPEKRENHGYCARLETHIEKVKVLGMIYGDMNQWVTRRIYESGIIGGHTKLLYELGPTQEIDGNVAYVNQGGSQWANSNVMAKVMGIVKTNTSVYPEKRENHGYCARLETHIEKVKVLGMINITVLASGSLYLGDMKEPITGTKDGEKALKKALNMGVPFTSRPKAVRYDYKVKMSGEPNRIRQTGFSRKETIEGQDCAIMTCLLQKRTEDAEGNIIAKRVGTIVVKYAKSENWKNGATYEIMYGQSRRTGLTGRLMKYSMGIFLMTRVMCLN